MESVDKKMRAQIYKISEGLYLGDYLVAEDKAKLVKNVNYIYSA